jgi:hypothetical protein
MLQSDYWLILYFYGSGVMGFHSRGRPYDEGGHMGGDAINI